MSTIQASHAQESSLIDDKIGMAAGVMRPH